MWWYGLLTYNTSSIIHLLCPLTKNLFPLIVSTVHVRTINKATIKITVLVKRLKVRVFEVFRRFILSKIMVIFVFIS